MIISLVFNGFFYAYEGRLLKKHTIHPLEMVGCEGVFGICYLIIIVTILCRIHCSFQANNCTFDKYDNAFM